MSEQSMPDVNAVYRERDQLAAALSKLFPSWLGPVDDAEPGWTGAIYIQLPTGQVSWHIPDEEAATLFAHVPVDASRKWDGHTTPEKYARLNALAVIAAQPRPDMAEIDRAIDAFTKSALTHLLVTMANEEGDAGLDSEATEQAMYGRMRETKHLIERALAVPAGHVLVPVAEIELAARDLGWRESEPGRNVAPDVLTWLRALLPERGDE